jgi:hypothetical protein
MVERRKRALSLIAQAHHQPTTILLVQHYVLDPTQALTLLVIERLAAHIRDRQKILLTALLLHLLLLLRMLLTVLLLALLVGLRRSRVCERAGDRDGDDLLQWMHHASLSSWVNPFSNIGAHAPAPRPASDARKTRALQT